MAKFGTRKERESKYFHNRQIKRRIISVKMTRQSNDFPCSYGTWFNKFESLGYVPINVVKSRIFHCTISRYTIHVSNNCAQLYGFFMNVK